MLEISKTFLIDSDEAKLAEGIEHMERGLGLVSFIENGQRVVSNDGSISGARFGGFSFTHRRRGNEKIEVETLVMGEAANDVCTVNLSHLPKTTTALIKFGDVVITTSVAANAVDTDSEYNITGTLLTLNDTYATEEITITYRRDLTALEAQLEYGDDWGPMASDYTGTIGRIKQGTVYTNNFDNTIDWANISSMGHVYVNSSGYISYDDNGVGYVGTQILNFDIVEIPSAAMPYLGIAIVVA